MTKWDDMWPQRLIEHMNSSGLADEQQLREALTASALIALTVVLYRILRRMSGRLLAVLAGRGRMRRASNFGSTMRGLSQVALLGAAPFAVWGLCAEGKPLVSWEAAAAIAAAIWALADVQDHNAIWWGKRDGTIVVQRGSWFGFLRREAWAFDRVFVPMDGGALPPVGAPRSSSPMEVRLTKRARKQLLPSIDIPLSWFADVAAANGWTLRTPEPETESES